MPKPVKRKRPATRSQPEEEKEIAKKKSSATKGFQDLSTEDLVKLLNERKASESASNLPEETIRCEGCNMLLPRESAFSHVCNNRGAKLSSATEAAALKSPEDYTSEDEIREANKKLFFDEVQTEEGQKYAEATAHGKAHEVRRRKHQKKFAEVVLENKQLFGALAEMVEDSRGLLVPKLFKSIGGDLTPDKVKLASQSLWLWVKTLKNSKAAEDECPHLEPNTQSTYLRTLMATMKEDYDWKFSLERDFNYQGGLYAKITKMFADRAVDWPLYGTGQNQQIPQNHDESGEVNISVFDEDNLTEHQKKCLLICGKDLGFRGASEHCNLLVANVTLGEFEAGHEYEGKQFVSIDNFTDKAHKITPTNTMKRKTEGVMRIPIIDDDDKADPGATLKRYLSKCAPGQKRFYSYEASGSQLRNYRRVGSLAVMHSDKPIGVNKIREMIKEATKRTGLHVTGQGLRRLFCKTMVNNPGVSNEESLASCRHGSMAAQLPYNCRDKKSEAAKFGALGYKK